MEIDEYVLYLLIIIKSKLPNKLIVLKENYCHYHIFSHMQFQSILDKWLYICKRLFFDVTFCMIDQCYFSHAIYIVEVAYWFTLLNFSLTLKKITKFAQIGAKITLPANILRIDTLASPRPKQKNLSPFSIHPTFSLDGWKFGRFLSYISYQ